MEKIINISGKDIKFKSSAGTLYRYRMQFGKDMLHDVMKMQKVLEQVKDPEEQISIIDLQVFEQIAWSMAKTADSNTPPIENWLDDFETFSIYEILPQLSDLMISNFKQAEKKNMIPAEVNKLN